MGPRKRIRLDFCEAGCSSVGGAYRVLREVNAAEPAIAKFEMQGCAVNAKVWWWCSERGNMIGAA
jgi:hypothetical protein